MYGHKPTETFLKISSYVTQKNMDELSLIRLKSIYFIFPTKKTKTQFFIRERTII